MSGRLLWRHGRLFTSSAAGVLDDGTVVVEDGRIAWVGPDHQLVPGEGDDEELDLEHGLVTPGLVDAHCHPLYAGERFAEIALRSAGTPYGEIAAAGGGIAATVAATRSASRTELAGALEGRLASFLAGGTTTLEAKTGYHLDEEGELAAVRLLAERAGGGPGPGGAAGPALEVTFLGGHAVGPEWAGDPAAYAAEVARWCPAARRAGARHADAFCDEGYFTVSQARVMLEAARSAGLVPRLHTDELARTGGAELAAELGCASADHLLCLDEPGIAALAAAGVVATLAPVTALSIGRTPPARALLDAGVTLALGSDHNPGTCGTTSMSLVVALGVAELGLSVGEALTAATAGGARSLRLADRGRLEEGMRADLVSWEADHEGAFLWSYGLAPRRVLLEGRPVA